MKVVEIICEPIIAKEYFHMNGQNNNNYTEEMKNDILGLAA